MSKAIMVALMVVAPVVAGALPNEITVQGTLLNEQGQAIDGDFDLKFSLHDAAAGGNELWKETQTTVPAPGGFFTTALGADLLNPLVLGTFLNNAQVWMQVQVLDGPGVADGGDPPLPRQPLTKVGAAFVADQALDSVLFDGKTASQWVTDLLAAVDAEGYLKPGGLLDQSNMPPNGLNEISNQLISNQFVDTAATSGSGLIIKDFFPPGTTDIINFPDIGIAESLTVSVNISNSDFSTVNIELTAPDGSQYTLLSQGAGAGTQFATSFPVPTPVESGDGDLTEWLGQNPKGPWQIKVVDLGFLDDNSDNDGQINSWDIKIQTLSTKKVQFNGFIVMNSNQIKELGAPTADTDAATKKYVDDSVAGIPDTTFLRSGAVYTAWGPTGQCPDDHQVLYSGFVYSAHHGHSGSGDMLCLVPNDPGPNDSHDNDILYQAFISSGALPTGIPSSISVQCTQCFTPDKGPCWQIPGTHTCPSGFKAAYDGYLYGSHHTHPAPYNRICMDKDATATNVNISASGGAMYPTTMHSPGNQSGKYPNNRYIKCAVCCRE